MKCIYLRTNAINGKQYVGQANDFDKRENDWNNLKWNYAGQLITNARNKYGTENFTTKILKECDTQEELNHWEQYYIKELNTKYPNGYNLTDGGDGISGYHFSEEVKKKMSEAKKKSPIKYWLGKEMSEEHKKNISESKKGQEPCNKGIPMREKTKKKLSETRTGKPTNKKSKTIYQYTKNKELVKIWVTNKELRKEYHQGNIWECCNGRRKTAYGYIWSYEKL